MKTKLILLVFAMAGLLFAGVQSVNAQTDVGYSVTFGWNDNNCSCNDPVTKLVRVIITEYPGGGDVDDSDWYTPSSNPETYDGDTDIVDCDDPCYTITVYIVYSNNTVPCCTGSDSANVTGQQLVVGYTFPNPIIMN